MDEELHIQEAEGEADAVGHHGDDKTGQHYHPTPASVWNLGFVGQLVHAQNRVALRDTCKKGNIVMLEKGVNC